MRAKLEVVALVLGFIGLFGTITITALPMWKVTAFIGLWMNCYRQADIKMQCKVYDSLLILPPELQAARGLVCVSIVLVVIALSITGCGTQKSRCCSDNMRSKNITLALGGSLYLLSFLTTIIPVSWVAHSIIRNFYNPTVLDSQKRELGEALFIGWATSGILLITGIILLFSFCKRRSKEEQPYPDSYLMPMTDIKKEESINLERAASSFHKHQEYV